jgi:NADH-quinone oxidoreductase subunit C/D
VGWYHSHTRAGILLSPEDLELHQRYFPYDLGPLRDRADDIPALIDHFLNVTWGPIIPAGEAFFNIEASKGNNGYYLISDGCTMSYRTRVRTPSFAHIQMLPMITRGARVSDVLAVLGAMDFVLADLDR